MGNTKYRVWDKENQQMIYFTVGQLLSHYCDEFDYVDISDTPLFLIRNDLDSEKDAMQFTGLKDKNGQEGYAGDLVKMFDRSLFRIVWNDDYARFQLDLVKGDELSKVHSMDMLQFSEIIGNVHAQHELLEGKA